MSLAELSFLIWPTIELGRDTIDGWYWYDCFDRGLSFVRDRNRSQSGGPRIRIASRLIDIESAITPVGLRINASQTLFPLTSSLIAGLSALSYGQFVSSIEWIGEFKYRLKAIHSCHCPGVTRPACGWRITFSSAHHRSD